MTRVVTALYDTLPQAELALAHLASEIGVEEGEIVDGSIAGRTRLARMSIPPADRAVGEREVAKGGFLVIARVDRKHDPDRIVKILKNIPRDGLGRSDPARPAAAAGQHEGFRIEDPNAGNAVAGAPADGARPEPPAAAPAKVGAWEGFRVEDPAAPPQAPAEPADAEADEERIPVVDEELRVGKREVLRGGVRVHAHIEEVPVHEEIELLAEHVGIARRPAARKLSEAELEAGGLLRERVFEFSEMREEAVVSKEAFVREELVVTKTIERRTERVEETVRRTAVETEPLPGAEDRPAFGGFDGRGGKESPSS